MNKYTVILSYEMHDDLEHYVAFVEEATPYDAARVAMEEVLGLDDDNLVPSIKHRVLYVFEGHHKARIWPFDRVERSL
jgi:hypothetical protein